jgi:hypothetical protein
MERFESSSQSEDSSQPTAQQIADSFREKHDIAFGPEGTLVQRDMMQFAISKGQDASEALATGRHIDEETRRLGEGFRIFEDTLKRDNAARRESSR